MSFSTPGMMSDEKRNTTLYSTQFNRPTAQSMFHLTGLQNPAAYQPTANVFAATHMRNPWANTALYTHNLQNLNLLALQEQQALQGQNVPEAQQTPWGICKQTSWGTSSNAINVQITPEATNADTNSQTSARTHTRAAPNASNTWQSAEELADALFPAKLETAAVNASKMHDGLLSQKDAIMTLQKTLNNMLQRQSEQAETNTILNSAQHSRMTSLMENSQIHDHVHKGLLNHRTELEKNQDYIQAVQAAILDLQNISEKQNTTQADMHEGLKIHKNAIKSLRASMQSLEGARGTGANPEFLELHQGLLGQRSAIRCVQQSIDILQNQVAKIQASANQASANQASANQASANQASVNPLHTSLKNQDAIHPDVHAGLQNHQQAIQELQQKVLHTSLKNADGILTNDLHDGLLNQRQAIVSLTETLKETVNGLKKQQSEHGALKTLTHEHSAHIASQNNKISLLTSGHNGLLDANNSSCAKINTLMDMSQRQVERHLSHLSEKHVEFAPRSRYAS